MIGIGAGADVDGQVLVIHDLVGLTNEFNPRFLRRYMNLYEDMKKAIEEYVSDVKSVDFPNQKEQYQLFALSVIYEDNHILVVNKTAGLLVQGDKTGDKSLIDLAKKYIKDKYLKPGEVFLGLVHRLDRPTTGVIVLARTSKALSRLSHQFKDRVPKNISSNCFMELLRQRQLWSIISKNSSKNKSFHYPKIPQMQRKLFFIIVM